jgi:hypothetical protein
MKKDDDEADALRYLAMDVLEQRGGAVPKVRRSMNEYDDFIIKTNFTGGTR